MKYLKTLAAAAALSTAVKALPAVTRQGKFLYSNGARFYVKGVAYQQQGTVDSDNPIGFPEPTDYVDPLADAASCARDLPYLRQLGVNAIRVYSVNSALNHDACMAALDSAGIYVILDLALPVNGSINRIAPAWSTELLNLYLGTIDAFNKYSNVLAYNIGNEVVTSTADTQSAPFIKAAARDVKAYLASKSSTALVGYASTDGPADWRLVLADFLACDQGNDSIDLYGLNVYRWCGAGSISNYNGLISDYTDFPIPAYLSEFGCVTSPPRLWTEVAALYGPEMSPVFSGGVAFSYFAAVGGYGMVTISADGSSVTTSDDFTRLATQYGQVSFINSPDQAGAGPNTQATCPAETAAFIGSSTLPPTPVVSFCDCVERTFGCTFSNPSDNTTEIVGTLLDYTCSTLPSLGGNCDAIGANGTSGTYGTFSQCDPTTKLNYALSQFYELSNRAEGSCSFSGNATVVSSAPSGSAAVSAAQSSCVSAAPTGATVPAGPTSTAAGTGGGGASAANPSASGGSNNSGAMGLNVGVTGAMVASVLGVVGGAMLVL